MSVQFGRWNYDGRPVDPDYLEKAKAVLSPYGPDDCGSYRESGICIRYLAFHTTKESRRETQPQICPSGAVLTWDGRLDNREELIHRFRELLTADSTDVSIVAAAYEAWGTNCFAKLIGDWAVSIWNPNDRSLILAKDFVGTRHLYYSIDKDQVTWSTILDPLILLAGRTFALEEEYIAGWLGFFPATHLTPYVGIHAVPPCCSVLIRAGAHTVRKYWDFDPGNRIRYHRDSDYEEHFRDVFYEAVRRRLRSDSPVLAELSGGMDSSSIVCMADTIIASGAAETPRLDTVSYYDDSEPNWNERPYFTKVEERRGRTGCHIDGNSDAYFRFPFESGRFAATPGSDAGSNRITKDLAHCLAAHGNRVLLSGIGGDEATGGVPTAMPELADLLTRAQFTSFAHQLKLWALQKRKPWMQLLLEAVRELLPAALVGVPRKKQPSLWLNPDFRERNRAALAGYPSRLKIVGPLPSFQQNLAVLHGLQRQLGCTVLPSESPYEKRYPYLDRGLLEFIYAVPREQIVRPGERRSLMRRALVEVVPDAILNRKRKAYVARSPMAAISMGWAKLTEKSQKVLCGSRSIIDCERFSEALQMARQGREVPLAPLIRAVSLELWLRSVTQQQIVRGEASIQRQVSGRHTVPCNAESHTRSTDSAS
jgi:asparagine synthase (glutamine-hydrolysing)